jgi:hypothetical protein
MRGRCSRLPSSGIVGKKRGAVLDRGDDAGGSGRGCARASRAWIAARSASAFRVERTSATVAGEELPDLMLGGRVERLVGAPLRLRQPVLGEVGRRGVGRDIGRDQIGPTLLARRRKNRAGFVDDDIEAGVYGVRINGRIWAGKLAEHMTRGGGDDDAGGGKWWVVSPTLRLLRAYMLAMRSREITSRKDIDWKGDEI